MKMIQVDKLIKVRFVKGKDDLSVASNVRLIGVGTDKEINLPLVSMLDVNLNETLVHEDCFTAQVAFIVEKNTLNDGKYELLLMDGEDVLAFTSAQIYGNDNLEQYIKRT